MAQMEASRQNLRVVSVVKRSCGNSVAFESVRVIEVKDLLNSRLSTKSLAPG